MVVYLQKHSVNSFYNLFSKILFTFNITAKYLQASRCMCAGGLPEIRADKDCQLSHPLFLCWVALGGDRVGFGQVCCAISSQQLLCCRLFACEFCLLGAL